LIGVVEQEPHLFSLSILQNIALGIPQDVRREMSLDEIRDSVRSAAELSKAHEFILETADQYGTQINQKGVDLSGGQKQRIAIARAIVADRKMIILDEATAAIDEKSQQEVTTCIEKFAEKCDSKCTVIAIAHRLNAIKNYDRIYVMRKGAIHEAGSHKELLQKEGLYFNMVNLQKE